MGRSLAHLALALLVSLATLGAGRPDPLRATSPCDLRYPSDDTIPFDCVVVKRGQTLESLFGDGWRDVARFNRIDRRHVYAGVRLRVPRNRAQIACFCPLPERFEQAAADSKFVLVSLDEQFLGAYESGRLVFSAPIAAGNAANPTPAGLFRITATHRDHASNLYRVEGTNRPYPMHYGLLFHVGADGAAYWMHGRDLPGVPASHGCIGLSDEAMQKECYGVPGDPELADARALYEWVRGDSLDDGRWHAITGPPVLIVGSGPRVVRR